jgi:hypothetical protein
MTFLIQSSFQGKIVLSDATIMQPLQHAATPVIDAYVTE